MLHCTYSDVSRLPFLYDHSYVSLGTQRSFRVSSVMEIFVSQNMCTFSPSSTNWQFPSIFSKYLHQFILPLFIANTWFCMDFFILNVLADALGLFLTWCLGATSNSKTPACKVNSQVLFVWFVDLFLATPDSVVQCFESSLLLLVRLSNYR